ncbi:glycosyltransferase [Acinetobacter pseudolwoffii]|uniref:glycosyltransferase n=1 Tax=Acinetobacter pseudolwoffii TaxID=2053287 RepID=UPI00132F909C|nr:glycosyltransferase [Acinetobacter pseudolwoffii]MDM1341694.1 glycosyltransferase [Acinetobacter pseudolwoffii]
MKEEFNQYHILCIVDHLKGGGAEKILLDTAINLKKIGHQVTIVPLNHHDIKMDIPKDLNFIKQNFDNSLYSGKLLRKREILTSDIEKINTIVSDIQPDLIILSHAFAFCLSDFINGNVWLWIHGEIFKSSRKQTKNLFRWYKECRRYYLDKKYFIKLFDGKNIITVNQDLEKDYKRLLPNSKILTIYNGLDIKHIDQQKLLEPQKVWDCIFVGRLSHEKQPEHTIRAFAKSQKAKKLLIVGDGDLKHILQDLCKQLNIENRVEFIGWVNNPYSYIQQSHLLVSSSISEGYGLVISEALYLDVPVVAYNVSDAIYHQLSIANLEKNLVTPQHIDELAEKIDQNLNQASHAHFEKKALSNETMVEKFLNLIKDDCY